MALNPHGSGLPGTLEGAPFHNDSFLLSFLGTANVNGVAVYVGALVTLSGSADFTCKVTFANAEFMLGVAQTSGQLQSTIDVICRGEVTVIVNAAVTAGLFLIPSAVAGHDGQAILSVGNAVTRLIALQTVDGSVTPAPLVALLY
jgi:hypothetical protein